jgi:hypothetical protein
MDTATKFRDDLILRAALNETLDLFGEKNKKIMIDMLAMMHRYGTNETSLRDDDGFLVYEKITEYIQQIFGSDAAIPILEHLNSKVVEHRFLLNSPKGNN